MRDAGISPATMGDDLGALEDEVPAEGDAPVDGGDVAEPDTATGADIGAPATTDQTV